MSTAATLRAAAAVCEVRGMKHLAQKLDDLAAEMTDTTTEPQEEPRDH